MLREFLKEVEAIEADLRAGKRSEEQVEGAASAPVGRGETKVVVVDDPWIRALFLAYAKRVKDAGIESPAVLMGKSEDEVVRIMNDFNALQDLLWAETRSAFGVFESDIGLRKDWTLVRVPAKPAPRFTMQTVNLGDVLAAAMGEGGGECKNPDCPIHGRGRERQQKKAAAGAEVGAGA